MLKVAAEGDDASVSALDLWSAMMKVGDAAATTTSSGGGGGGGGGAGGGAGAGGGGGDATSSSWSTLLSDGLHLSAAGATFTAEAIMKHVATTWPELGVEALPMDYPHYSELVDAPRGDVEEVFETARG